MALRFRRLSIDDIEASPGPRWSVGFPSGVRVPSSEDLELINSQPSIYSPSFLRRAAGASGGLDDLAPTTLSEIPNLTRAADFERAGHRMNRSLRSVSSKPVALKVPMRLGTVEAPARALLCVERKIRRQVILARGKGGGAHRRPRRSWKSEIFCR